MRLKPRLAPLVAVFVTFALVMTSCGKSEDSKEKTATTLERIAQETQSKTSDREIADALTMMEGAGYTKSFYDVFPAQEVGRQGRMLLYSDKDGKSSGGVIFLKKTGFDVEPAWHWYFKDMVPESAEKVELNDDGLWDLRISSKDGNTIEYLQDESFTLTARHRSDWMALNGSSSRPLDDDSGLWRCFDSDTSTAWRSSRAKGDVYVELTVPFGIAEEILTLQTLEIDQPRKCTLYADGKKVQEFELESKAALQMIRLASDVKGAKKIRLTFDSVYGNGDVVSVAELALK